MTFNKNHATELKSLAYPPQDVKSTLTATLILMGYPVKSAENWNTCQKFLSQANVLKSMAQLDLSTVTSLQISQAREKLHTINVEQISNCSLAAAGLFRWMMATMREAESMQGGVAKAP